MANNLRYLLEHFMLDGQKIDISSQLDEENAEKIEKLETEKLPQIQSEIDDINNNKITDLNGKINAINNTTIPSVNNNIAKVNTKAENNTNEINKLKKSVSDISTHDAQQDEYITQQGNTINTVVNETIPTVNGKVSKNTTDISNLSQTVNNHTTQINSTIDDLNNLTAEVSDNTTNINGLTQNLTDLSTNVIPKIQGDVKSNKESISSLDSSIQNLRDDVNVISGKTSTNTNDISDLTDRVDEIESVANRADETSNSLVNDMSQANSRLDAHTKTLASQSTSIQKIQQDVEGMTTIINDHSTQITDINQTKIPHLQEEIDALSGGSSEWVSILNTTSTDGSLILRLYQNTLSKLICVKAEYSSTGKNWNSASYVSVDFDVDENILPISGVTFSSPTHVISGAYRMCGILNVVSNARLKKLSVEFYASNDYAINAVMGGVLFYAY